MNHYHDAAIADSPCIQRAFHISLQRHASVLRLAGASYVDSVNKTLELFHATRIKSYHHGYHAINNECERLVG